MNIVILKKPFQFLLGLCSYNYYNNANINSGFSKHNNYKVGKKLPANDLLLFLGVQLSLVPQALHLSLGDQLYRSSQEDHSGLAPLVHLRLLDHRPNPKIQNNITS